MCYFVDTRAAHETKTEQEKENQKKTKRKTKQKKNKTKNTSTADSTQQIKEMFTALALSRRAGRYSTTPGGRSDSVCNACNAGTANPLEGQSQASACVACERGQWAEGGSDNCTSCTAGRCFKPYHSQFRHWQPCFLILLFTICFYIESIIIVDNKSFCLFSFSEVASTMFAFKYTLGFLCVVCVCRS